MIPPLSAMDLGVANVGGLHILGCPRVATVPAPRRPIYTLADCESCREPIWLGPHQRQLITEFNIIDADFRLSCRECVDDDSYYTRDTASAADRLRLLRGEMPRHDLVAVYADDLPAIVEANPDLEFLLRR